MCLECRRLIEVSGGKMSAFHTNLLSLRLESNSSASKSISDLREKDSETTSKIAIGFSNRPITNFKRHTAAAKPELQIPIGLPEPLRQF